MTKTRERMAYIAVSENKVKVGATFDPQARIAQIAEWMPYPIKLAAVMSGGYAMEAKLMRYFADSWSHSEWFHMTPKIQAVIDAANSGALIEINDPDPSAVGCREAISLKRSLSKRVGAAEARRKRRNPSWDCERPQIVKDAIASYMGVSKGVPSPQAVAVINGYIAELDA